MSQVLKRGTLLRHETYRLERLVGQGGFGITYLATDLSLDRRVAIKEFFAKEYCDRNGEETPEVSLGTSTTEDFVANLKSKFLKEAKNLARLDHHGIVKIHAAFEENNTAYYVMDFIDGETVSEIIKKNGPFPVREAVQIIIKIGEAIEYIHTHKINHLDIKPANIMIRTSDNLPVLIDFGLSKQYDDEGQETSTSATGVSHGYSPIEMYKAGGVAEFSPQTDIYSLAATLYYLITGKTPPHATDLIDNEIDFPDDFPENLRPAMNIAMAYSRKNRYDEVKKFSYALKEASFSFDSETIIDVVPLPFEPEYQNNEESEIRADIYNQEPSQNSDNLNDQEFDQMPEKDVAPEIINTPEQDFADNSQSRDIPVIDTDIETNKEKEETPEKPKDEHVANQEAEPKIENNKKEKAKAKVKIKRKRKFDLTKDEEPKKQSSIQGSLQKKNTQTEVDKSSVEKPEEVKGLDQESMPVSTPDLQNIANPIAQTVTDSEKEQNPDEEFEKKSTPSPLPKQEEEFQSDVETNEPVVDEPKQEVDELEVAETASEEERVEDTPNPVIESESESELEPYTPEVEKMVTVEGNYSDSISENDDFKVKTKSNLKYLYLGVAVCVAVVLTILGMKMFNGNNDSKDTKIASETTMAIDANDASAETLQISEASKTPQTVKDFKINTSEGPALYTGEVNDRKLPHGKGVAIWKKGDGKKYDGEWVNGDMHGKTTYTLRSGDVFEGTFKNNEYAEGKYSSKKYQDYYIGTFKNGKPFKGAWYDKKGKKEEDVNLEK